MYNIKKMLIICPVLHLERWIGFDTWKADFAMNIGLLDLGLQFELRS